MSDAPTKTVLHVGCGVRKPGRLHAMFTSEEWREVRLDLNPDARPDLVANITDMRIVDSASVDAVYSSHNLEHLLPHDVPRALAEFRRVLKPGGLALVAVPDLRQVAALIAEDKADEVLYTSPLGPVTPLDVIYGHKAALARGNHFMAHRTGFTATTLGKALAVAGFGSVRLTSDPKSFSLWAQALAITPEQAEKLRAAQSAGKPDAEDGAETPRDAEEGPFGD